MVLSKFEVEDRNNFFVEDFLSSSENEPLLSSQHIESLEGLQEQFKGGKEHIVHFPCHKKSFIRTTSASQLQPGDEICTWFLFRERFNAIVESVDCRNSTFRAIGYKFRAGRATIEKVTWKFKDQVVYRVDYDKCHNRRIALARALACLGEKGYGLFNNQCRDFTKWCKTDKHDTHLDIEAIEKALENSYKIRSVKSRKRQVEGISDAQRLRAGAHIGWQRAIGYWHHAIVEQICGFLMTVIHFSEPPDKSKQTLFEKGEVSRKTFDLREPEVLDEMFEWRYDESSSTDTVLARAKLCIGKKGYNFLANNCQHFATWCKTGIVESKQVQDFLRVFNYAKQKAAAVLTTQFPRLVAEYAFADFLNVALGCGVIAVIEGYHIGKSARELHLLRQENARRRENGLEELSYGSAVTNLSRKVGRGIFSMAGFLIGEFLLPVGGGLIGGFIGSLIGEGLGFLVGRGIAKLINYFKKKRD